MQSCRSQSCDVDWTQSTSGVRSLSSSSQGGLRRPCMENTIEENILSPTVGRLTSQKRTWSSVVLLAGASEWP
jgi:hypothetical protein